MYLDPSLESVLGDPGPLDQLPLKEPPKKRRKRDAQQDPPKEGTSSRKENHKLIEQKRRQKINEKINELRQLLNYPEGTQNKAVVLQAAVDNIRCLKMACNKLLLNHRQLQDEYMALLGENDQLKKKLLQIVQTSQTQANPGIPQPSISSTKPVQSKLPSAQATSPLSSEGSRQSLKQSPVVPPADQFYSTSEFTSSLALTPNDVSLLYDEQIMGQLMEQSQIMLTGASTETAKSRKTSKTQAAPAQPQLHPSTSNPGLFHNMCMPRFYNSDSLQQLLDTPGLNFDGIATGLGLIPPNATLLQPKTNPGGTSIPAPPK